jgi:hypothetical protein
LVYAVVFTVVPPGIIAVAVCHYCCGWRGSAVVHAVLFSAVVLVVDVPAAVVVVTVVSNGAVIVMYCSSCASGWWFCHRCSVCLVLLFFLLLVHLLKQSHCCGAANSVAVIDHCFISYIIAKTLNFSKLTYSTMYMKSYIARRLKSLSFQPNHTILLHSYLFNPITVLGLTQLCLVEKMND